MIHKIIVLVVANETRLSADDPKSYQLSNHIIDPFLLATDIVFDMWQAQSISDALEKKTVESDLQWCSRNFSISFLRQRGLNHSPQPSTLQAYQISFSVSATHRLFADGKRLSVVYSCVVDGLLSVVYLQCVGLFPINRFNQRKDFNVKRNAAILR